MFFLDGVNICTEDYSAIWNIVGLVINVIKIGVPILLIVLAMIDFAKALISGKEDEQKKASKSVLRRFLYAIAVFATFWIVTTIFDVVSSTVGKDTMDYDESSWTECWNMIKSGHTSSYKEACFLCGGSRSGKYEWKDASFSSSSCTKQSQYTDKDSCLANNK